MAPVRREMHRTRRLNWAIWKRSCEIGHCSSSLKGWQSSLMRTTFSRSFARSKSDLPYSPACTSSSPTRCASVQLLFGQAAKLTHVLPQVKPFLTEGLSAALPAIRELTLAQLARTASAGPQGFALLVLLASFPLLAVYCSTRSTRAHRAAGLADFADGGVASHRQVGGG